MITHETGFFLVPTSCFEVVVVTPGDLKSRKQSSVLGILEMLLFMTMPKALKSNLFTGSESNFMVGGLASLFEAQTLLLNCWG